MMTAIGRFLEIGLKISDKISFKLHRNSWGKGYVDVETIEIVEKEFDKELLNQIEEIKRANRSSLRQQRATRSAIYDDTIGWYRRIYGNYVPVKKGSKGKIYIVMATSPVKKRYLKDKEYEVHVISGRITKNRPKKKGPDLTRVYPKKEKKKDDT